MKGHPGSHACHQPYKSVGEGRRGRSEAMRRQDRDCIDSATRDNREPRTEPLAAKKAGRNLPQGLFTLHLIFGALELPANCWSPLINNPLLQRHRTQDLPATVVPSSYGVRCLLHSHHLSSTSISAGPTSSFLCPSGALLFSHFTCLSGTYHKTFTCQGSHHRLWPPHQEEMSPS